MLNLSDHILNLKKLFPNNLFDVIIGVLLGDASIQRNKGKQEKQRLKFLQSAKHKDYIFHLHSLLQDFVAAEPFFDPNRKTYSFQTLFDSKFNGFADIFINKNGKKGLLNTAFFKDFSISAITLTYWFMDDGGSFAYSPRRGFTLNTQGFTYAEVQLLSDNLNQHFGINSKVTSNKGKFVISIVTGEGKKVKNIIYPHLLPLMYYKLPTKY